MYTDKLLQYLFEIDLDGIRTSSLTATEKANVFRFLDEALRDVELGTCNQSEIRKARRLEIARKLMGMFHINVLYRLARYRKRLQTPFTALDGATLGSSHMESAGRSLTAQIGGYKNRL